MGKHAPGSADSAVSGDCIWCEEWNSRKSVWSSEEKQDSIEDFDPRPMHLHNTAPTNLSTFLTSVRDLEPRLGVSVLIDETLTSQHKVQEEDIPQMVMYSVHTPLPRNLESSRSPSNGKGACNSAYAQYRRRNSNMADVL